MIDDPNPTQFTPGTHGCHEALHMAHVLAEAVDIRLCDHPAIMMRHDWGVLARKAGDALHELYQAIGKEHFG